MFKNLLLAGAGGAIGTMMRYLVYFLYKHTNFPLATLLINIAGSLVIGIVFGIALRNTVFDNNWKIFLATGICGGFTTFSALSLENLQLLQQGKYFLSAIYIAGSIVGGLLAVLAGYKLTTN
jgi:CrcB protein